MALRNIGIVYRKELTEAVRDRRTLISTILVPLILFPLLGTGMISLGSLMYQKAAGEIGKVAMIGGADSPVAVAALKKLATISLVPLPSNWKNQIVDKKLDAAVEIPAGFDRDLSGQKKTAVTIFLYDGELKSTLVAQKVEKFFDQYRESEVKTRLQSRDISADVLEPFEVKRDNVAPPEKSGAAIFLGGFIAYMVVFLCLNGGMHPAMDLTAGEKERGTMETVLSSPVSRSHLVLGKFLLVLTTALLTAALSVISMGVSFWLVRMFQQSASADVQLHIGIGAVLSVFIMALPLSVLFASVLLAISAFARSYKEAQSYIVPVMLLVIIPAVAAMLPGIDLTPKLAVIPVLNVSLLCKELVIGTYHWGYIAVIFISTCVYAAIALFFAIKMFQRESVLFRS